MIEWFGHYSANEIEGYSPGFLKIDRLARRKEVDEPALPVRLHSLASIR